MIDVEARHGYFMAGYEHSWLLTKYRNIIDVYPVGMVGGPILIARQIRGSIYIVKDDFDHIKPSVQVYELAVNLLEASMREIIECCI